MEKKIKYKTLLKVFKEVFYERINEHLGGSQLKQHMMEYAEQSLNEAILKLTEPVVIPETEEENK